MQTRLRLQALPAQLLPQRCEGRPDLIIVQGSAPRVKKQGRVVRLSKNLGPSFEVGPKALGRAGRHGHAARLTEFALADGQDGRVRFPVRDLEGQRLGTAQTGASQQTQQRVAGARIETFGGQLLGGFQQTGQLVWRVNVDRAARSVSRAEQACGRQLGARIKARPEEGEMANGQQAPRSLRRARGGRYLRPVQGQRCGQGATMALLLSILDQVLQQSAVGLQRKPQATTALQIERHGGFERTGFHASTSPGQG